MNYKSGVMPMFQMKHYQRNKLIRIDNEIKNKWQQTIDITAKIFHVPAGLIMRLVDKNIEVFLSSQSPGNPYKPGDKESFLDSGLYCETVIRKNKMLMVPNALADEHWKNNPDVKLNMISYLGFPIHYPNGKTFGTICVLDNKENHYSQLYIDLIISFRDAIERDIELLHKNQSIKKKNTELKESNEKINALLGEKEVLLKETHHRIKNNLTVVKSLLSMQAKKLEDPNCKKILLDAASRMQSMIVLYNKLYRSNLFGELSIKDFIPSLINEIVAPFPAEEKIRTSIQIEDFILPAKTLSSLAIIINECITNSIKHAFKNSNEPLISVQANRKNDTVILIYSDNGCGISDPVSMQNSETFGFSLIKLLTDNLHGVMQIENQKGLKYTFEFPVSK